jgi:hypothetical protein
MTGRRAPGDFRGRPERPPALILSFCLPLLYVFSPPSMRNDEPVRNSSASAFGPSVFDFPHLIVSFGTYGYGCPRRFRAPRSAGDFGVPGGSRTRAGCTAGPNCNPAKPSASRRNPRLRLAGFTDTGHPLADCTYLGLPQAASRKCTFNSGSQHARTSAAGGQIR